MPINLTDIRKKVEQLKGQKAQVEKTIHALAATLEEKQKALSAHEEAKEILRAVGIATQEKLQYHIADITSLALDAVFDDPYELKVEFVLRRNKTECDLTFVRNGLQIVPKDASGVGAIDVAAFALRIASWSMMNPRTRPVIVLDEPFRFLSVNYQERASAMIKEVADKLGLQFIIITHEQTLTSSADKVFEVSIHKGITKVC